MQNDLFPDAARKVALAQSFTGGAGVSREKFRAPRFMPQKLSARKVGDKLVPAVAFTQADYEAAAAGKVTYKFRAGKAQGCDELTKKRARAVGMFEGWREVVNEPVRQRVGLAGMAASYRVD